MDDKELEIKKKRLEHAVKMAKAALEYKPSFSEKQKEYIIKKMNEMLKEDFKPSLTDEQRKHISKRINEMMVEIPTQKEPEIRFVPSTRITADSPIVKKIFGRR